ncbi:MAG TPA: helix-turn-helix domain-containing protein, partial [Myxococcaceae bacterium]|nr:helix-turn-helix domain-containing protein [Myxococcaceae bacterium]
LSMRVHLDAPDGHPLLVALPPLIRVTPERGFPSLALAVEALLDESLRRVPGRGEIVRQLSEVLFVHALRSHLDDMCWNDVGWFRAFADPLLRHHLHWTPDGQSSVNALAEAAHRSTRGIRARFGQLAGLRLSTFLRSMRARRAARLLRGGEADLERITALTGYGSRQALARAFRRELGVSPTEFWRKVHRRPFPRPTPAQPAGAGTSLASPTPTAASAFRLHPSDPE